MKKNKDSKSKIRAWLESRGIKMTRPQWHILRGRYTNIQLRAMTGKTIRNIIKEA